MPTLVSWVGRRCLKQHGDRSFRPFLELIGLEYDST